ncbi:MAG: ankyrin repeat domain-containing protein, partial [Phycisphaerales bacterium JB064]
MRRPAIMLALLAMLGLATSLAIAWAGALVDRSAWPNVPLTKGPTGERTELRGWLVETGRDATLTWRTFEALDLSDDPPELGTPTRLPAWSVGYRLPDQPGPFAPARERTRDLAWEISAGWPMRCVRAERGPGPAEFALPGEFVRGGLAAMAFEWPIPHGEIKETERAMVPPWPIVRQPSIVPVRPIALGLLVNSIVFAIAWAVLLTPLVLPGMLRRRHRRRRCRCVGCGHTREGLPTDAPCPECGRPRRARTPLHWIACGRGPALGAGLALCVFIAGGSVLIVQRWMSLAPLPPLHRAAAAGDARQIERLLAAGADPNAAHGHSHMSRFIVDDTTALTRAAALGHADAAMALLAGGARADAGSYATNPVAVAMQYGHDGLAMRLLEDVPPEVMPLGFPAVFPSADDAMRLRILEHLAWSSEDLTMAAAWALRSHDRAAVELLVAHGLDRALATGQNLLVDAVSADAGAWWGRWKHDAGMTRLAIALGLDDAPNAAAEAMRHAILSGCPPALDALLEAYPDRFENTPPLTAEDLATAALRGGPEMLARLVERGIDPNVAPRQHFNALWYAAVWIEPDALEALLIHGVDPTLTADGQTLRQWLVFHRDQALADPAAYPDHPFLADPPAFERICDLLEAAEALWAQREARPG